MLTMRFLLTFHSVATGQWRCLDTALLPGFRSGRARDLPAALRGDGDLVMRWMMGRYLIGDVLLPASAGAPGGPISVYALDPAHSVIGFENEYVGPWLEVFQMEHAPLGHIGARKMPSPAMASLTARAARPLDPASEACRMTVSRVTAHRQVLARQREEAGQGTPQAEKV